MTPSLLSAKLEHLGQILMPTNFVNTLMAIRLSWCLTGQPIWLLLQTRNGSTVSQQWQSQLQQVLTACMPQSLELKLKKKNIHLTGFLWAHSELMVRVLQTTSLEATPLGSTPQDLTDSNLRCRLSTIRKSRLLDLPSTMSITPTLISALNGTSLKMLHSSWTKWDSRPKWRLSAGTTMDLFGPKAQRQKLKAWQTSQLVSLLLQLLLSGFYFCEQRDSIQIRTPAKTKALICFHFWVLISWQ